MVTRKILLALISALMLGTAQAGLIDWQLTTTMELEAGTGTGTDTLGIDGAVLTVDIAFDDTETWGGTAPFLYLPSASASASFDNGVAVSLNSSAPAALYITSNNTAYITEAVGISSLFDLIVGSGNILTQTFGFVEDHDPLLAPSTGDLVQAQHLIGGFRATPSIQHTLGGVLQASYNLTQASIRVSGVPAPLPLALLAIGLAGIGFARRKTAAHT